MNKKVHAKFLNLLYTKAWVYESLNSYIKHHTIHINSQTIVQKRTKIKFADLKEL